MSKKSWNIRLWMWVLWYHGSWNYPMQWASVWRYADQPDWEDYRKEGWSPQDACLEDLSYA